jgi:hypothetical protein
MYEIDNGWWFVPNALNKFTVSPRNELQYNADGSLPLGKNSHTVTAELGPQKVVP